MSIRTLACAAIALLLPLSALACTDDTSGDLTLGDLSSQLQNLGLDEAQADCAARIAEEAELTPDAIEAYRNDPRSDSRVGAVVAKAIEQCLTPTTTGSSPPR